MIARPALRRSLCTFCALAMLSTSVAILVPARAAATTILPLDLVALTGAADRVFKGTVVSTRSGRDGRGLPATWTTFEIQESLKGTLPHTLEIKQIGTEAPLADGAIYRVPALPHYQVGDEVILFLHPDSAAGFTSPVGLGQGRFRIRHGDGAATAENDVGNVNLRSPARAAFARGAPGTGTAAAAAAAPSAAPIPVDDLMGQIRALAGAPH
jgi:hypothetical protein